MARKPYPSDVTDDEWAFAAAHHQWMEEAEKYSRSRVYGMMDLAAEALEKAIQNGDGRLALQLLRGMGVVKPAERHLVEVEDARKQIELDRKKIKSDLEEETIGLKRSSDTSRYIDQQFEEMFGSKEKKKDGLQKR